MRCFVRMPEPVDRKLASAARPLMGGRRPRISKADPQLLIADLSDTAIARLEKQGGKFYPNLSFEIFGNPGAGLPAGARARYWNPPSGPAPMLRQSLADVMKQI